MAALRIDDVDVLSNPDDVNIRFAIRWIEVAPKLVNFVHRHGPWKPPRSREEFEHLWYDFEEVLADLVGSYLNLLNRVDRILAYKAPTPGHNRNSAQSVRIRCKTGVFLQRT